VGSYIVEEKQTQDVMFIFSFINIFSSLHSISGVMVGMLASSVEDCGFEPQLAPTMGKQLLKLYHMRLRVEYTLFVIYKARTHAVLVIGSWIT
jgi:hypothetical protein